MEEQENQELSKEEILGRSRKENEAGDERQIGLFKYAPYCGYLGAIFSVIVCLAVFLIKDLDDLYIDALLVILATSSMCQTAFQAVIIKRKKLKIISIVCAALIAICAVGEWILFGFAVAGYGK